MSFAELKEKVAGLSSTERLQLSAFLADLDEANEDQFRAEVDARMKLMDAGQKVTMEQLEEKHRRLSQNNR